MDEKHAKELKARIKRQMLPVEETVAVKDPDQTRASFCGNPKPQDLFQFLSFTHSMLYDDGLPRRETLKDVIIVL